MTGGEERCKIELSQAVKLRANNSSITCSMLLSLAWRILSFLVHQSGCKEFFAACCHTCCCIPQSFASEQCPEGFVAVKGNTLRILSVDNIGETFNQSISRLRYTPRRLLIHPDHKTLIVAESDYQAVPLADNPELQKRLVVSAHRGLTLLACSHSFELGRDVPAS